MIIFIQLLSIPILGQRRKIGMSQKKMMMGGGVRTGTRVRPTTTLGLPGYQGRQSGAGNNKEITLGAGGLKKKKKGPSKSKADSLLNLLDVRGDIRSPAVVRKKSQEGGGRLGSGGVRSGSAGGRSGQGGGRGGVIGSSVTLSRQAPGSSGATGGSGTGTSLDVGQDCGFSGTRVCSGHSKNKK